MEFPLTKSRFKKIAIFFKNLLTNQVRHGIINSERLREEHKAQAGSTGFTLTKGQVRSFGEPADLLQKILKKPLDKPDKMSYNKLKKTNKGEHKNDYEKIDLQ